MRGTGRYDHTTPGTNKYRLRVGFLTYDRVVKTHTDDRIPGLPNATEIVVIRRLNARELRSGKWFARDCTHDFPNGKLLTAHDGNRRA